MICSLRAPGGSNLVRFAAMALVLVLAASPPSAVARKAASEKTKAGIEFEREALLMFSNALNEQRHLAGVMLGLETQPDLREFLQSTKAQLDERYTKSRRY